MSVWKVNFLGGFTAQHDGRPITGIDSQRARELFAYLVLHRRRIHFRDALATLMWRDLGPARSRKNLRHVLWQLQSALNNRKKEGASLLLVQGNETIRLNPDAELELDVARLEKAFSRVGGVAGADLDGDAVQAIKEAARLYQGELLPGEYQDWCVFERERLQNVYLALLDKLIHYCESNHAWEEGIDYGLQILRLDHARERTHRTLMRIYARAGDRTAALRQYHRCLEALHEEFDVGPAVATEILYENLRNDRLRNSSSPSALRAASREAALSRGGETLERLQGLRRYLGGIDREISAKIDEIEGLGDDETRRRNWS